MCQHRQHLPSFGQHGANFGPNPPCFHQSFSKVVHGPGSSEFGQTGPDIFSVQRVPRLCEPTAFVLPCRPGCASIRHRPCAGQMLCRALGALVARHSGASRAPLRAYNKTVFYFDDHGTSNERNHSDIVDPWRRRHQFHVGSERWWRSWQGRTGGPWSGWTRGLPPFSRSRALPHFGFAFVDRVGTTALSPSMWLENPYEHPRLPRSARASVLVAGLTPDLAACAAGPTRAGPTSAPHRFLRVRPLGIPAMPNRLPRILLRFELGTYRLGPNVLTMRPCGTSHTNTRTRIDTEPRMHDAQRSSVAGRMVARDIESSPAEALGSDAATPQQEASLLGPTPMGRPNPATRGRGKRGGHCGTRRLRSHDRGAWSEPEATFVARV